MKIKHALGKYSPDKRLKVGAEEGSSFFYAGTVGDFLDHMENYSYLLERYAQNVVDNAVRVRDQKINNPLTIDRFIKQQMRQLDPAISLDDYKTYLARYFDGVARAINAVNKAKEAQEGFKYLHQRKVIKIFESDPVADYDTTIMIIEGYEKGKYWTISEADGNYPVALANNVDTSDPDDSDEAEDEE